MKLETTVPPVTENATMNADSPERSSAPTLKVCSACGLDKPLAEFGPRATGRYRLREFCRECGRTKTKRQRARKRHAAIVQFCDSVLRADREDRLIAATVSVVGRFGGASKFSEAFREHLQEHPREWRRSFNAIAKLTYTSRSIIKRRQCRDVRKHA